MGTDQLRAALAARTGAQDPVVQASLADTKAGLAMLKPLAQWTAEDKAAVRQRAVEVMRQGW